MVGGCDSSRSQRHFTRNTTNEWLKHSIAARMLDTSFIQLAINDFVFYYSLTVYLSLFYSLCFTTSRNRFRSEIRWNQFRSFSCLHRLLLVPKMVVNFTTDVNYFLRNRLWWFVNAAYQSWRFRDSHICSYFLNLANFIDYALKRPESK